LNFGGQRFAVSVPESRILNSEGNNEERIKNIPEFPFKFLARLIQRQNDAGSNRIIGDWGSIIISSIPIYYFFSEQTK